MSSRGPDVAAPFLRTSDVVEVDGILHGRDAADSAYRRRWESEAAEDAVLSAIAVRGGEAGEYESLVAKISDLWRLFPAGRHVPRVLELGSGYGRIPLYLARERALTWDVYCAVDISENMLRQLRELHERFELVPGGSLVPVCASIDELPFDDDSFDLVLSSAVFLHMGKTHVARALAEAARVLAPGGAFLFDASFPNSRNPASLPARLRPRRSRPPNFMKYWSRAEVEGAIDRSGLPAKSGPYLIEPNSYALLPKNIGPVPVPLARRVNSMLGHPQRGRDWLAASFSVSSANVGT
jgi:arsenite methyltransferase